jgi:alkylation response protein AidB-like acyl-CoA dehydrogenase
MSVGAMTDSNTSDDIVKRVAKLVPAMRRNAAALDDEAIFPAQDLIALAKAGALSVTLPTDCGDHRAQTDRLAALLTSIGSGNLSVGRLFEAHVNALHLLGRYGTDGQRRAAGQAAARGELHAVWVTDPAEGTLHLIHRQDRGTRDRWILAGAKMFCSGAGHVAHAVVTAITETCERQMLIVPLGQGERAKPLPGQLQGMRSAVTGMVDFTGVQVDRDAFVGRPGDYLREPDFSCGAWRASAVALGGLGALLDVAIAELRTRDRVDEPNQLSRLGRAMIARETSRLWVQNAARIADDERVQPGDAVAYVGLARLAVEAACLDVIRLVQRSLGLAAFRHGHPAERICRDLGTYLRQPAPDEVLTEAASWFAHRASHEAPA